MGVSAHLRRLALGRSSDEPPDWDSLTDQFEIASTDPLTKRHIYRCISDDDPVLYGRIFDDKGRPCNPGMRDYADRQAEAMDAVTRYVVDNENEIANSDQGSPDRTQDARPPLKGFRRLVVVGLELGQYVCSYYLRTVMARTVVWRPLDDASFLDIVSADFRSSGSLIGLLRCCFVDFIGRRLVFRTLIHLCVWDMQRDEKNASKGLPFSLWRRNLRKYSLLQLLCLPIALYVDLDAAGAPVWSPYQSPLSVGTDAPSSALWLRAGGFALSVLLCRLAVLPAAETLARIRGGGHLDPSPTVNRLIVPLNGILRRCDDAFMDCATRGLGWLVASDGLELFDGHWLSADDFLRSLRGIAGSALLLPITAVCLRSTVGAYAAALAALGNEDARVALDSRLRAPVGSWAAGASLAGYASKLGLCYALHATSCFVLFGASIAARRVGRPYD